MKENQCIMCVPPAHNQNTQLWFIFSVTNWLTGVWKHAKRSLVSLRTPFGQIIPTKGQKVHQWNFYGKIISIFYNCCRVSTCMFHESYKCFHKMQGLTYFISFNRLVSLNSVDYTELNVTYIFVGRWSLNLIYSV